jgi:hypothetical protein
MIFLKYFRQKIWRIFFKILLLEQTLNRGFLRTTPFFWKHIAENAENCDHNIDPRYAETSF